MAKIVIADDSDMMRKIAKMSLEKGGHQVLEASNGIEAIDIVAKELPDVVLLDAEMPEMDGWEACKKIKTDAKTSHIPVIMCTGHDLSEEPELLTQAGASDFISKPYNAAKMLEKISHVLAK